MGDGIYDNQARNMQKCLYDCFNDSDDDDNEDDDKHDIVFKAPQSIIEGSQLINEPITHTELIVPLETNTTVIDTITIDDEDSGDDKNCDIFNSSATSLEYTSSIQPINYSDDTEFTIKYYLDGKLLRIKSTFQTPLSVPFSEHMKECQRLEGVFIVRADEDIIDINKSPKSLNLKASTILDASYIYDRKKLRAQPGQIKLKLQDGNRKNTQMMFAYKDKPLGQLKAVYADMQKLDVSHIRFMFDGDPLNDEMTPEEYDIEEDCVIDVFVTK